MLLATSSFLLLAVMASNLRAMASTLVAMASNPRGSPGPEWVSRKWALEVLEHIPNYLPSFPSRSRRRFRNRFQRAGQFQRRFSGRFYQPRPCHCCGDKNKTFAKSRRRKLSHCLFKSCVFLLKKLFGRKCSLINCSTLQCSQNAGLEHVLPIERRLGEASFLAMQVHST